MNQLTLAKGPFDGLQIICADRIPDRIELSISTLDLDVRDTETFHTANENIIGADLDLAVFLRNAKSLRASCEFEEDHEAAYYRFTGWTVEGSSQTA